MQHEGEYMMTKHLCLIIEKKSLVKYQATLSYIKKMIKKGYMYIYINVRSLFAKTDSSVFF